MLTVSRSLENLTLAYEVSLLIPRGEERTRTAALPTVTVNPTFVHFQIYPVIFAML